MQCPAVYRRPSFLYPNTLVALTVLSQLSRDMEEGERAGLEDLEDRGRGRLVSVVVVVKQGIMAKEERLLLRDSLGEELKVGME
jgi:hypothetical protein